MYKKTLDNNKRKRANFFFRCSLSPPLLVIRPNPFLHLFSSSDYHSVVLRSNEEGSFLLGPPQHLPRRWETVRIYEVDTFGIETVFSFPAHHQPVGRETNKELEQLGQVLRKKREKSCERRWDQGPTSAGFLGTPRTCWVHRFFFFFPKAFHSSTSPPF